KYVVRQNESLVQSVGGALEQLIAFYLAVNFDVPRVRDRFVLGDKITFIFLLVFGRCRRWITAGFVAGRRCARFRLSVLNGCLVALGRANTPYYHEQNAQNQTKVYEISLHRTRGSNDGCLITQEVTVYCQLFCREKVVSGSAREGFVGA